MDLLRDNVRAGYRKYFLAAFGSALISCIYGVVDMAMVGQYQGPDGTAVLAWAGVWLLAEPILRFFSAVALAIYGRSSTSARLSSAVPCRPCGARRGRCRRAKTGPVCIHSFYRG